MPWAEKKLRVRIHVFRGQAHLALVLEAKRGRNVVEIGHAVHVDPGLRYSHHHIGVTEAQPVDQNDMLIRIGDLLAHEVLAGDAEVHHALRQQVDDLGCREICHLDPGKIGDSAAVIAHAARLDELEPGAREEGFGVLLQPALGRHGDDEGCGHGVPRCASRSIHTAKPTAEMALALPRRVSRPS